MVLKKIFMALATVLALASAHADFLFENDSVSVLLYEQAGCSPELQDAIHNLAPDDIRDLNWNRAVVTLKDGSDDKLEACWAAYEDKDVVKGVIIDENLDGGMLPLEKFVKRQDA